MRTRVKICGITRGRDAEEAVRQGAAAVGFVFVKTSPRSIEPDEARAIVRQLPPYVTPVGVVAGISRSEALALAGASGVRCLQVCDGGREDILDDLPFPHYRVFRVGTGFSLDALRQTNGEAFMLDTLVEGALGGTGRTFDWSIAVRAKRYGLVILSGGLDPLNAGEAVRRVSPYAIDVSSGVERSPGVKDHDKLRRLFAAVAEADNLGYAAESVAPDGPDPGRKRNEV